MTEIQNRYWNGMPRAGEAQGTVDGWMDGWMDEWSKKKHGLQTPHRRKTPENRELWRSKISLK